MAKLPHLIKKKAIENAAVDGDIIKILEGQSIKAVSAGQDVDLIKVESGVVKALGSEIELKSSSESKLAEAKAYADQIKSDIMGGLPATALDTIKELADAVANDESGIASLVSSVSSLNSGLAQEIADRQSAINNEASARQAAVNSLQTQISSAVSNASGSLSGDLSAEEAARIAADLVLDGKISTEKSRAEGVEATLSSSIASETSARQSADSALDGRVTGLENNKASKVYVDNTFETKAAHNTDKAALEASIASEVSARQSAVSGVSSSLSSEISRAQGEESRIEGKVDSEIANRQSDTAAKLVEAKSYSDSQDAAKLLEAKSYTDGKISDLIGGAPAMMDTLKEISDAISAGDSVATGLASSISDEVSRAQSAESVLDGKITTEKNRAEAAEAALSSGAISKLAEAKSYADTKKSEAQSYADAAVLVEKNRAEASESSISSSLSSEVSRAQAAEGVLTSAISSESTARQSADSALDSRVTGLENGKASKTYVDNTFETKAAHNTDKAALESSISSEASRAQAAESALSTRVGVIEAMSFGKEKLTISGSVPASFTLAQLAHTNSIFCFVGAVPLHEGVGEGFTVSVSGGKSVITFNTDALSLGDKVFFYYHY